MRLPKIMCITNQNKFPDSANAGSGFIVS